MKSISFSILVFFLMISPAVSAGAETVLLYSESPVGTGDAEYSIFYMEDGIMDVFFQAGHIIFNGSYQGAVTELPEEAPFRDHPSFRLAKTGGASHVLEIRLHFSGGEDGVLPESAKYRFVEVHSERSLAEGAVSLSEAGDPEELEDFELVRQMGRIVGMSALRGL